MSRHATPLILLHWLTAFAVVVAYVSSGDPTEAGHALSGQIHVASGLAVLLLVALRLPLRWLVGVPPGESAPRWQQRAAHWTHVALYALMFAVPLAGWAELADKAHAFSVLGWALPLPLPDAGALWVRALGAAHTTLGDALVWLAGLHATAALAHHYVLRDGTLTRMLPRRAR